MDDGFRWEGGQASRLTEAQTRAESAIARVREREPKRRPTPSFAENVEGQIRACESEAKEAQARLGELTRLEFSPVIPIERPPTAKERNDFAKERSRDGSLITVAMSWRGPRGSLNSSLRSKPISTNQGPWKNWRRLFRQAGYEFTIVEKTSAEQDFPRSLIHGPENLVRIPRFKRWEINSWYMTKNEDYERLSPKRLSSRKTLG